MSDYLLDPLAGCRAYLQSHRPLSTRKEKTELPVVTISRESGAGALKIGELTAQLLNEGSKKSDAPPWTVFDKNLVERVLEDQHLPENLRQFLPEDVLPMFSSALEETLGLHPSAWNLAQLTAATIYRLAKLGNAILVGRGSNFITAKIKPAIHIRLVAPIEERLAHIVEFHHLTPSEAVIYAKQADRGRRRYVKRYFNAEIEDPLNYTLTINTGRMDAQTAAHIISEAIRNLSEFSPVTVQ